MPKLEFISHAFALVAETGGKSAVTAAAVAAAAGPRFRAAAVVDLAADNHSECECLFRRSLCRRRSLPAVKTRQGQLRTGSASVRRSWMWRSMRLPGPPGIAASSSCRRCASVSQNECCALHSMRSVGQRASPALCSCSVKIQCYAALSPCGPAACLACHV